MPAPRISESMSDPDEELPRVPIVCEACDTETTIPFEAVEETIDGHNERMHDGEPVAEIHPDVRSRLQDLLAEELGLLD